MLLNCSNIMKIVEKFYKLFLMIFVMKNFYVYLFVLWKIKTEGNVYFKTKPDRLSIEINLSDIKQKEATECLYLLARLLYNNKIYSYNRQKDEIGVCAFNKKTVLKFDLFHMGNIVYPALSAGFFIEEYNNDFFLVTVKDGLKFIARKENKYDVLILKNIFVNEEYGKYLPNLQGKIILDIGGYIGDTAIHFSHLGASKVYVYEPHPVLYQMLAKNVEINNLKNITTINCGVSDEDSIISIKEKKKFDGPTWSFGSELPKEQEGKAVEIETVSFKKIIENIGEIDFMKMDCEGYEFPALLSCDRVHLKKIKKMVLEYHGNPEEIAAHLKKNGFVVNVEKQFLTASLL
jgi:FkbM family methyltransferase